VSVRGVPVQDLPENQDPGVRFTYDEVLKKYVPWDETPAAPAEAPVEEKPAKRRGRPPKVKEEPADVQLDALDDAAAGAGE
jgi:hypothetical protein